MNVLGQPLISVWEVQLRLLKCSAYLLFLGKIQLFLQKIAWYEGLGIDLHRFIFIHILTYICYMLQQKSINLLSVGGKYHFLPCTEQICKQTVIWMVLLKSRLARSTRSWSDSVRVLCSHSNMQTRDPLPFWECWGSCYSADYLLHVL